MQQRTIVILVFVVVLAGCGSTGDTATTGSAVAGADDTTTTTETVSEGGAQDGDVVSVHYIGTLDDGSQFDSSYDRDEPLTFEVGTDQMIPGFDAAVHGMAVGDKKTVRIPAEEAYGEVDETLIFQVAIEDAPTDVAVGDEVLIDELVYGRVTAVDDSTVTIDTNHRFAGQALTFEIEMVGINE